MSPVISCKRANSCKGTLRILVAALALVALSGCTSGRDSLGSTSDRCFSALPVAASAVGNRGHFSGVEFVSADSLSKPTIQQERMKTALDQRAGHKVTKACLILYVGSFTTAQVKAPLGTAVTPEPYAIVAVEAGSNKLLATVVRSKVPLRFRHDLGRVS